MASSTTTSTSINVGLPTLLFLVLLVLKLTHVIGWSWWIVTAPLWAPAAFVLVVGILIGLGATILAAVATK